MRAWRILLLLDALALGFLIGMVLHDHYYPRCTYLAHFHPVVRPWSEGIAGVCEEDAP